MNDFTQLTALLHTAATMFLIIVPSAFAIGIAFWVRSAMKLAKSSQRQSVRRYR